MTSQKLLLGILFVLVFAVGFAMGRFGSIGDTYIGTGTGASQNEATTENSSGTTAGNTTSGSGGTTVSTSNLTEGQKKMLTALGIDTNTITVTPAMIACAEASLGPARVEEIKNGATPSFGEGVKLVACYK